MVGLYLEFSFFQEFLGKYKKFNEFEVFKGVFLDEDINYFQILVFGMNLMSQRRVLRESLRWMRKLYSCYLIWVYYVDRNFKEKNVLVEDMDKLVGEVNELISVKVICGDDVGIIMY